LKKTSKCQICGFEITEKETYLFNGKTLCEDCHMEETHPVTVCNPWPVLSAKKLKKPDAQKAEEQLGELQKSIYNYIMLKKRVTVQELCNQFNISEVRLQNQMAVLRHLELVKGQKDGNKQYIVLF
jgi:predicted HTH transcriptional regulator